MPLSISNVAGQLNVKYHCIHRLIASGQLKAYKIGGLIRIYEDDLDEYLKNSIVKPIPLAGKRPKQELWKPGMRLNPDGTVSYPKNAIAEKKEAAR